MYTSKFSSFIAGVVDTADKHRFANITSNFRKIQNSPNGTLIYEKNFKLKNLGSDSLQVKALSHSAFGNVLPCNTHSIRHCHARSKL
jgi:hypothetical protein